jgi:hypothetical protein
MTGKFLNALKLSDIVSGWEYSLIADERQRMFKPDEVLHRKEPNANYSCPEDIILGKSRVIPLQKPLSNITMAYESRNVIARQRGISVVISPSGQDPHMGFATLNDEDQKRVEDSFKQKYGMLEGQNQYYFSPFGVDVKQIDQDIRKLGILEEIGSDAMIVSNVFNIPFELLKMFFQGATYDNQMASDRRMYQVNTIPRITDFFEDLNNWLKTRDNGFEWFPSWEHIAVLQEDKKNAALVDRHETFVCEQAFKAGAITYNQWLVRIGFPKTDQAWGDKRITEMSDKEIQIILGQINLAVSQNTGTGVAPESSNQV